MGLLARALVVASTIVIAFVAWRYLRTTAQSSPPEKPLTATTRNDPLITGTVDPAALAGIYQGPIQHANGTEEWLVLEIARVVNASDDEVAFDYTLSSSRDCIRDHGHASGRKRWIRFGGFSGEIRTRPDGAITLRSAPIDGPPNWMLDGVRSAAKSPGDARR